MRICLLILIFLTLSNVNYGQSIYSADRAAYKSNKFIYEYYLFEDSTCYLKGHYIDNSSYFLYKGHLKRTNDTLYIFHFQPLVKFGCNKRFNIGDSITCNINQKDTTLTNFKYKVETSGGNQIILTLNLGFTTVYIKDVGKKELSLDTKFIDPITKKIIHMNVDTLSEPDLTYFGSNTDFVTIKITIINNKITIYPDYKFIQNKDTFTLQS